MDLNESEVLYFVDTNKSSTISSVYFGASMVMIFKAVAYVAIMLLSLCGNTLVLVVVKKNIGGQMRSTRCYLLTSMAAIDLLITVGSMPERLTRVLTNDEWLIHGSLGLALCKMTNFFEKLSLSVSTLNIVLVAIDRFLAIMFPHKTCLTSSRVIKAIGLVWLFSAIYCSPILYYGGLLKENEMTLCKVRRFFPHWKAWYLLFLAQLLLSLVLVLLLYGVIIYKLWQRQSRRRSIRLEGVDSLATNRAARGAKINRKVLKMVAAILIAFYVCFVPYWLGWVFCSYYHSKLICNNTYIFISIYLSYANSSLNPIIYCAFSESFRLAFKLVAGEMCRCFRICPRGGGVQRRVSPQMALNAVAELSPDFIMRNQGEIKDKDERENRKWMGSIDQVV